MKRDLSVALRMTLLTLVLTGILYPLLVTGLAQLLFPGPAGGSLVGVGDEVVGSYWIGQRFASPAHFQGRPSAAGPEGYDASASAGFNLPPTSVRLSERIRTDRARLEAANPQAPGAVPAELLTASASGLDPHLSPASALWQAPRVARDRQLDLEKLRALVLSRVEPRTLGFLGEPRVNVLLLNLELDRRFGRPAEFEAGLSRRRAGGSLHGRPGRAEKD